MTRGTYNPPVRLAFRRYPSLNNFPPSQIQNLTQSSIKPYLHSITPSIILELALDKGLSRPEMGPNLAAKLLNEDRRGLSSMPSPPPQGSEAPPPPMNPGSPVRPVSVLLFLLTVAPRLFAWVHFISGL